MSNRHQGSIGGGTTGLLVASVLLAGLAGCSASASDASSGDVLAQIQASSTVDSTAAAECKQARKVGVVSFPITATMDSTAASVRDALRNRYGVSTDVPLDMDTIAPESAVTLCAYNTGSGGTPAASPPYLTVIAVIGESSWVISSS